MSYWKCLSPELRFQHEAFSSDEVTKLGPDINLINRIANNLWHWSMIPDSFFFFSISGSRLVPFKICGSRLVDFCLICGSRTFQISSSLVTSPAPTAPPKSCVVHQLHPLPSSAPGLHPGESWAGENWGMAMALKRNSCLTYMWWDVYIHIYIYMYI